MTFWETIQRGEYVMIALAVVFIAVIVIWWVKGARLYRQRKGYGMLMQRIRDHVTEGDLENARQLCKATATPGARVVEAGLARVGKPMSEVRSAMTETSRVEESRMETGVLWLRMIAAAAPLLGLGGTLVGVIDRLRDLAETGYGADIPTLGGAIAPTIVTTVAGLGVGIFSLLAYSCLNSAVATSKRRLEELYLNFTNLLEEPS